jgi:predicted phosphodiesterase
MANSFFTDMINSRFNPGATLDISGGGNILVVSDFHMGGGRGDDLEYNGALLTEILRNYYLEQDWFLILNGDIEELQRFSLEAIRHKWPRLYAIFDAFAEKGRLYKTLGNHDESLLFAKNYPYPLYSAIRIETSLIPFYVYHGHQSSRIYTDYNNMIGAGIRYILKPFGIRNIFSARSPYKRFFVEKQAYEFSLRNHCISIIGHTHRALFESLGRFEYIKFEIERLCRDYAGAVEGDRKRIQNEIAFLRNDLGKLGKSEKRDMLRQSLYGDDLPVPCLFNSGCAIGRQGFNAIELNRDTISLVYWYAKGASRKFVERGWYQSEAFRDTPYRRLVLNHDRLDYICARIDLLGREPEPGRVL